MKALEERFEAEVRVPGEASGPNAELEKALRVKDFFGLAQLMLRDALAREESCGAHFREEHQSDDGEARRDDVNFAHIAAWTTTAAASRSATANRCSSPRCNPAPGANETHPAHLAADERQPLRPV